MFKSVRKNLFLHYFFIKEFDFPQYYFPHAFHHIYEFYFPGLSEKKIRLV